MIRLYADFNNWTGGHIKYVGGYATAYEGGRIPLYGYDGIRDTREDKVEIKEGMHVIVYDGECQAEAIVERIEGELWGLIVGTITIRAENE